MIYCGMKEKNRTREKQSIVKLHYCADCNPPLLRAVYVLYADHSALPPLVSRGLLFSLLSVKLRKEQKSIYILFDLFSLRTNILLLIKLRHRTHTQISGCNGLAFM